MQMSQYNRKIWSIVTVSRSWGFFAIESSWSQWISEYLWYHGCCDSSLTEYHRCITSTVEYSRLDPDISISTVYDCFYTSIEVLDNMHSTCWTWPPRAIGRWSSKRKSEHIDEIKSCSVIRHPETHSRESCSDNIWNYISFLKYKCERPGTKSIDQFSCIIGNICRIYIKFFTTRYVKYQRIVLRASLGDKDTLHCIYTQSVGTQSIDRLSRKSNKSSWPEYLTRLNEWCMRCVKKFCVHYFFGSNGTKTLVFFLYSSHSGLHAYLASWSGTPETYNSKKVITIQPISPRYENGSATRLTPSQNTLSPK